MLSKGHAGKQGEGIAEEGRLQGQKDQVLPVLHLPDAQEGGQEEGDHDRQEKGASQLLQADALVGGDGLCKKEHHIYKQAAQGGQTLSVVVDPEGDQARQHDGVAGDAGVLQKAGRPEHLMHRDHGQSGNQQAQGPGVGRCNSVDEHQQQRDKDHRHKDSLAHCHTPPNRRSRL